MVCPLRFRDAVRHRPHLLEPPLQPWVLPEKVPRHRAIARARLLDEARRERRSLGERGVVQDASLDGLGDEELVVVAESGDELSLREELALLDSAESFEHPHHVEELLPVRVSKGLERLPLLREPALDPFESLPLLIASRLRAPGAAMTLGGGQRPLGAMAPLAPDQVGDVAAGHLLGEQVGAPLPIARDHERRRLPEDALDVAFLHLDRAAVREKNVNEGAVTPAVHPADEPERRAALPTNEREPAGLGLDDRAPPAAASPARYARRLDLRAQRTVAADAREVAARRSKSSRVLMGDLETVDLGLDRADPLHVLVLAERGLHRPPDRRHVLSGREQERHRAVPELELAHDRLRGSVDDALHVVEPVAHVQRHHALAFGVDAAAAGAPRPLAT